MKAYYYIIRVRILTAIAYRFEVFSHLGVNTLLLLTSVFLWQTVYRNTSEMAGVNKSQMIIYTVMAVIIGTVFRTDIHWRVNERIHDGHISFDIIRPIFLPLFWLAEDIGTALSNLAMYLLPLIAISVLLKNPPLPADAGAFLLFIPAFFLSFFIVWLMSAMIAMVAFWALELGNLSLVKDTIIRFLSGSIVPIWFFPESFQNICWYMPFIYIYQGPIGIYIGKYDIKEGLKILIIQITWVFILSLIFTGIWSRAKKRVLIQGG
ncbi:MAG: ABC-2 family transporter protein [Spirochaetes bacterium]|nr:ABC-2 family transporter protein [Spirochaetota bacterium]